MPLPLAGYAMFLVGAAARKIVVRVAMKNLPKFYRSLKNMKYERLVGNKLKEAAANASTSTVRTISRIPKNAQKNINVLKPRVTKGGPKTTKVKEVKDLKGAGRGRGKNLKTTKPKVKTTSPKTPKINKTNQSSNMKPRTPKGAVQTPRVNRRPNLEGKSLAQIGAAGVGGGLLLKAIMDARKGKKSDIPRPPSSTGVQDKTPIAKDKTPSSDAGTKGLPTGAKQRAVDKMNVASKNRKLKRRPASNRLAPPTGKGGDSPLQAPKSGTTTFGSFKEAFKYYHSLPKDKRPSTFNYKGKSYANVTKDEVKKAGFKTLRAYMNAQRKKKKK